MPIEDAGPRVQNIGGEVLDFSLEDLTGRARSLSEELSGKKGAVAVFWSCVCSHCLRYDEYLNSFRTEHPGIGLLAIASRQQETRDELGARRTRSPTDFFRSSPIRGARLARQWFAEQTPRAFLIASDMRLVYRGAIDNFQLPGDPDHAAYLDPAIADLVAGRPVAHPETPSFGCAIQSVYYQLQKII